MLKKINKKATKPQGLGSRTTVYKRKAVKVNQIQPKSVGGMMIHLKCMTYVGKFED